MSWFKNQNTIKIAKQVRINWPKTYMGGEERDKYAVRLENPRSQGARNHTRFFGWWMDVCSKNRNRKLQRIRELCVQKTDVSLVNYLIQKTGVDQFFEEKLHVAQLGILDSQTLQHTDVAILYGNEHRTQMFQVRPH